MFKDKWSGFVGVTSEADLVLCSRRPELASQESTMRVVTITATNEPLIHAMVKGLRELWLHFSVAAIAKHRLRHREQRAFHFGMMSGMAIDAANVVLKVL